MGQPIAYDFRVKIVAMRKRGNTYKAIAKFYNLSESGVKKIWYNYQKNGSSAYHPDYSNCGRPRVYQEDTQELISQVRDNEQGGNYVRSKLCSKYPNRQIPSVRTIQRLWVEQKTNRSKGRSTDRKKKSGVKRLMKRGK